MDQPPNLSDREFASALGSGKKKQVDEATQRNVDKAGEVLGHVFALRNDNHFGWFWQNGLMAQLKAAEKETLRGEGDGVKYRALAELHDWYVKAEIHGRKLMDVKDPEIKRLTATLLLE